MEHRFNTMHGHGLRTGIRGIFDKYAEYLKVDFEQMYKNPEDRYPDKFYNYFARWRTEQRRRLLNKKANKKLVVEVVRHSKNTAYKRA